MPAAGSTVSRAALPALFFSFFIMGLVDIVGVSANYVRQDFSLSGTLSALLPLLAFISFAFLAVPAGLLMNRIGRKRTVVLSLLITLAALVVPMTGYMFARMMWAFTLIGIGNTLLQTSLNPLLGDVVPPHRLTTDLTLGQFFRSLSSFAGPLLVTAVVWATGSWQRIFPVYALFTVAAIVWLGCVPIAERKVEVRKHAFAETFGLLKDKYILQLFCALFIFVGIDVGMNVNIPLFLQERCGLSVERSGLGPSIYFVARIVGSLIGAIVLLRYSSVRFLFGSLWVGIGAIVLLLPQHSFWVSAVCITLIGLVCANIFSIIFALALSHRPDRSNEISGLLIMAVSGGAIVPALMGWVYDRAGLMSSMSVLAVCFVCLILFAARWRVHLRRQ